jgi:hypothetical protein
MENALRMTLIFVWCMFFGFFAVMGYLDETLTAEKKTVILVGLLLLLTAYLAFEWFTRNRETDGTDEELIAEYESGNTIQEDPDSKLDERVLRRLHLYTKDNKEELQAALKPDPPNTRKQPTLSTQKK